jgi:hypothetical protein
MVVVEGGFGVVGGGSGGVVERQLGRPMREG